MLSKLKKQYRKQSGFTIIEVIIVLAIAALILLIVFLAVPALQRNSRNTSYRTEAARILAVSQEAVNNANGLLPGAAGGPTGPTIKALANTKNITTVSTVAPGTGGTRVPTLTTAWIEASVKCGPVGGANIAPVAGPATALIVVYAVENGDGSVNAQCTES